MFENFSMYDTYLFGISTVLSDLNSHLLNFKHLKALENNRYSIKIKNYTYFFSESGKHKTQNP